MRRELKILKAKVVARKEERDVRRTLRSLREVWMEIGIEKLDSHEGVTVKAFLDSRATGFFVDKKLVEEYGFKLEKLDRLIEVKNVNSTSNSSGNITHKLECNVFYKEHSKRLRMDMCDLGRTKMILDMPWLAAHNPEINWKTGEIKMLRCPPWCKRKMTVKQRETREENRKNLRWIMEDREREEEVREDRQKVEDMIPRQLYKWLKVFGKQEPEWMPVCKT